MANIPVFYRTKIQLRSGPTHEGMFLIADIAGVKQCGNCNDQWQAGYCNLVLGHDGKCAQVLFGGSQFGQAISEWDKTQ